MAEIDDVNNIPSRSLERSLSEFVLATTKSATLVFNWPEATLSHVSQRFTDLFGYAHQEVYASNFFQNQIHPDDLGKIKTVAENGLPFFPGLEAEFRLYDKEGRTVRVRSHSRLLDHDPSLLLVAIFDISRQNDLEVTGALSRKTLEEMASKMPVPQFNADFSGVRAQLEIWRKQGIQDFQTYFNQQPAHLRQCVARIKMIAANDAATDLFGAEQEKELLDTFHRLNNPLSFRIFGAAVRRLAEGDLVFEESVGSYSYDNTTKDLKIRCELLPGFQITWTNLVIWVLEDKSGARTHPDPGSGTFYQQLFERIPSILLIIDPESGKIVDANPAASEFYQYKRNQLVLMNVSQLFANPNEGLYKELAQVKNSGVPVRGLRAVHRRSDKQTRDVEMSCSPAMVRNRIMLVVNVNPLREIQKTEDALLKASRMEATANLAGGIAHDFNNLMAVVLGNASLLSKDSDVSESEREKMISEIVEIAEKAGNLAQKLLSFARGGKYQPELISLNEALHKAVNLQSHGLPDHVKVNFDLQGDLWPIKADPTQLEQVIINLCINASESIHGSGTIQITTRNAVVDELFARPNEGFPPGNYVCLSFQDTGIGMSAETRSRLFEPYFSTKSKGRGLGMAAVYGIVKNHNGQIFVLSEPGQGSTFTLYLPAEESPLQQVRPRSDSRVKVRSLQILLIDDDPMVLSVSKRMLEHLGHQVFLATNGKEAVDLCRDGDQHYDAAFLDMGMPVMDGFQAFPLLHEARPEMKIIICTGYQIDTMSQQLLESGASALLRKPFKLDALASTLAGAVPDPDSGT